MNYMYKHSWDNTHEDLLKSSNHKTYTFSSDIYKEEPFFQKILGMYGAKPYRRKVFNREAHRGKCPACNHTCGFYLTTDRQDTYMVVCANPDCRYPNGKRSMLLHEIIMHYGSSGLIKEWRDARYTKELAYGWKGIRPENRKKKKS